DYVRRIAAENKAAAALAPPTLPSVPAMRFSEDDDHDVRGFQGLTNFDQRNAGTGIFENSQFTVEPPDQGLCVADGFVMEMVNDAIAVYDEHGRLLAGPTPQNQFFGLRPEVIRSVPPVFGEFTSDPKCVHDPGSDRWFATLTEIDTDNITAHV